MRHAAPTDFHARQPADWADLSTPERMAIVMRRSGESTTRADFLRAPETCDLTYDQLEANVGAAARIVQATAERQVHENPGPPRPLMPWDADPDYRKERVARAGTLVAVGMADTAAIVATLERGGYDPEEMIALWDEIMSEALRQLTARPHLKPLAAIVVDLEAALAAWDGPGLNAEARQLAQSMRVALEAMRGQTTVPRHHVLRTADAFADALEWNGFPGGHTPRVRAAVALLRKLWGL